MHAVRALLGSARELVWRARLEIQTVATRPCLAGMESRDEQIFLQAGREMLHFTELKFGNS